MDKKNERSAFRWGGRPSGPFDIKVFLIFLVFMAVMTGVLYVFRTRFNTRELINSKIEGRIREVQRHKGGGFTIKLLYQKIDIDIVPRAESSFSANKGDSLYKAAYSDSIFIIRDSVKTAWHIPVIDQD